MTATVPADGPHPAQSIVERAAQWCATIHGGDATSAELDACRRWRAEHPDHELALRRLEAVWSGFDTAAACTSPVAARQIIAASLTPETRRPRAKAAALLAAIVTAAAVWAGLRVAPPAWLLADHRTRTGEWRVVELPDHSRITLNTDSAIDVQYDGAQRLIALRRGEILVEVAKEASGRPFIVQTPDGTAQALGTRYVVRLASGHTDVSVTESIVRACTAAAPAACVQLASGQRARLSPAGVAGLPDVDPEAAQAWTHRSLAVDNQPLASVLDELARYRNGRISYDASALAGLRVSGVFPLDDTDRALQALLSSLPLTIRRCTPLLVVVEPR
ncbi:FecR family protein [Achromobacter pestifer]|uniref:Protein FecR n=1 Tax=Achromobacter pestifer TaxID=1353889 RepID=A0A6S6ZEZ2_9BURK|nr:FecR family protein [Achromobacter pestifer]CAB3676956.1 Protein FecR [Achromobacter pestifer]